MFVGNTVRELNDKNQPADRTERKAWHEKYKDISKDKFPIKRSIENSSAELQRIVTLKPV